MQEFLRSKKSWGDLLLVIFLVIIIWLFGIKTPAYSVSVDGAKQFVVEHKEDVAAALDDLHDETYSQRVAAKLTFVKRDQLVPAEKVSAELKLAFEPKVAATAIFVNGNPVAYLPTRAAAETMLEQWRQTNAPVNPGETLLAVSFEEQVEVVDGNYPVAKIMTWNDAWNMINLGTDVPVIYEVKPGDCLWTIARANDMYVSDITQTNNLREDAILALGQEIILNKPQPMITVIAQVQGTETVPIPYQTTTTADNSINGVRIKVQGQNGEKFVAYTATKRNGEVESKEVSEEKILKEAVDRVLIKGKTTYTVASRSGGSSGGRLDWPVYGSITQSYSGRHTGLDIAGPSGTGIGAAEEGTVTFAGWDGGYGRFVIIQHNNGLVTRYAHCSKIYVSVGEWVSQGQTIAARGSTGHSTGPHLHFEVLQNGSFRNPINYLN